MTLKNLKLLFRTRRKFLDASAGDFFHDRLKERGKSRRLNRDCGRPGFKSSTLGGSDYV